MSLSAPNSRWQIIKLRPGNSVPYVATVAPTTMHVSVQDEVANDESCRVRWCVIMPCQLLLRWRVAGLATALVPRNFTVGVIGSKQYTHSNEMEGPQHGLYRRTWTRRWNFLVIQRTPRLVTMMIFQEKRLWLWLLPTQLLCKTILVNMASVAIIVSVKFVRKS